MLRYLALIVLGTVSTAAWGNPTASSGMQLSGTVSEVCQIQASNLRISPNRSQVSASVFEMCNSGRSFRIFVYHRTLSDSETVQITYDGGSQLLNPSGVSDIALRSGPSAREVPVSIRSDGLREAVAISIGIAPV